MQLIPTFTMSVDEAIPIERLNGILKKLHTVLSHPLVALRICAWSQQAQAWMCKLLKTAMSSFKSSTILVWFDAPSDSLTTNAYIETIGKLCRMLHLEHVCFSPSFTSEPLCPSDVQGWTCIPSLVHAIRRECNTSNVWLVIQTILSGNYTQTPLHYKLKCLMPMADQLRLMSYYGILGGATGLIVPIALGNLHQRVREDHIAALGVLANEAMLMSEWWRSGVRCADVSIAHPIPVAQHLVDSYSAINVVDIGQPMETIALTRIYLDEHSLISVVRWSDELAFHPPVGVSDIRIKVPTRALPARCRAYALRFPSLVKLPIIRHTDELICTLPQFETIDTVLLTSDRELLEWIHERMNALAGSVMQFEVQQVLNEYNGIKRIHNTSQSRLPHAWMRTLNEMSKHVGQMLNSARHRHTAHAIQHAHEARRHYRKLLAMLLDIACTPL
ncbi:MAG TPA: hypothetical protein EYP10_08530 [Armatimonadetes bacterium]|nr:hypothetical protein [Armatimonadota bacterium]